MLNKKSGRKKYLNIQLSSKIQYIKSKQLKILSYKQVQEILTLIQNGRLNPSIRTNIEHVAHVKKTISSRKNQKVCPKCGSSMLVRESQKGSHVGEKFWGCSNFPKCRGVVKIV